MNPILFYRISGWRKKLPLTRFTGYLFLGYALGFGSDILQVSFWRSSFWPIFLNTLAIYGLFMFSFAINDFYDYTFERDDNYVGHLLEQGKLSRGRALALCSLPLLLLIPSCLLYPISSSLAIVALFLFTAYSAPPLRLKETRVCRTFFSPIVASLIFLQACLLSGQMTAAALAMSLLVFLFHCYMEGLHILDDMSPRPRIVDPHARDRIVQKMKNVLLSALLVSLIFAISIAPIFLTTTLFSTLRMVSSRKIKL